MRYGNFDLGDPSSPLPQTIGRFTIHGRFPGSTRGIALEASASPGVPVVLKLARAGSPELGKRILRELTVLRKLRHPGVVRLVDSGLRGDLLFIAIERLEGVVLRTLLEREQLDFDRIVTIGLGVGTTLAYLHEVGIIQRDVTPDAIIIDANGRPILADFGLAMVSQAPSTGASSSVSLVHLGYLAPELLEGVRPSPASDQYALGRLIYELCVPRAVRAESRVDWSRFPREGWFEVLAEVLARMLAPRPGDRYRDLHTCIVNLGRVVALKALGAVSGARDDAARPDLVRDLLHGENWPDDTRFAPSEALEAFVEELERRLGDPAREEAMSASELAASLADMSQPVNAAKYLTIDRSTKVDRLPAAPVEAAQPPAIAPEQREAAVAESRARARAFWEEQLNSGLAELAEELGPSGTEPLSERSLVAPEPSTLELGYQLTTRALVGPVSTPRGGMAATLDLMPAQEPIRLAEIVPAPRVLQVDHEDSRSVSDVFDVRGESGPREGAVPLHARRWIALAIAGVLSALVVIGGASLWRGVRAGSPESLEKQLALLALPKDAGKPIFAPAPGHVPTELDRQNAAASLERARSNLTRRDLAGAKRELGACIELADLAGCHQLLALLLSLSDHPAARAHLQRWIQLAPQSAGAASARVLLEK